MSIQIDPICGMAVEDTDAVHAQYNDTIYYFCSEDCQRKFEELLRETSDTFKGSGSKSSVTGPD